MYTQLYLTQIDEQGNDSPAILVDNTTAANRAANIPEFINVPKGGLERINAPATEFYRLFNVAMGLMKQNREAEAIPAWREALKQDPEDGKAHFNLGYATSEKGDLPGAVAEYRKASELIPNEPAVFANLALALAESGNLDDVIQNYRKALALNPENPMVEADLGTVLAGRGQTGEGLEHARKAVEMAPGMADPHNKLASVLVKAGQGAAAAAEMEKAVQLAPDLVEYRLSLAVILGMLGRSDESIAQLQRAADLSGGADWQCFDMLGAAYFSTGRPAQAVAAETESCPPGGSRSQRGAGRDATRETGALRATEVVRALQRAIFTQQFVDSDPSGSSHVQRMLVAEHGDAHVGIAQLRDFRPNAIHFVSKDQADGEPRPPVE